MNNLMKWHDFASHLCDAMGKYAYVTVSEIDEHRVETFGDWAGKTPVDVPSRAPHIAYGKMGELVLLKGGVDGQLVMTPVPGNEKSYGWMGAVAKNGVIVAVSKWAQEHDRLLALLTLYNAVYSELELHHVGFRFPTREAYDAENALFRGGLSRPATDHDRMYFPVGGYYREHQFFPNGTKDNTQHWDFVCEDPAHLLTFLAGAYDQEPVTWEAGPNDPIGVVSITAGSDGAKLGVMARCTWWNVEETWK